MLICYNKIAWQSLKYLKVFDNSTVFLIYCNNNQWKYILLNNVYYIMNKTQYGSKISYKFSTEILQ